MIFKISFIIIYYFYTTTQEHSPYYNMILNVMNKNNKNNKLVGFYRKLLYVRSMQPIKPINIVVISTTPISIGFKLIIIKFMQFMI